MEVDLDSSSTLPPAAPSPSSHQYSPPISLLGSGLRGPVLAIAPGFSSAWGTSSLSDAAAASFVPSWTANQVDLSASFQASWASSAHQQETVSMHCESDININVTAPSASLPPESTFVSYSASTAQSPSASLSVYSAHSAHSTLTTSSASSGKQHLQLSLPSSPHHSPFQSPFHSPSHSLHPVSPHNTTSPSSSHFMHISHPSRLTHISHQDATSAEQSPLYSSPKHKLSPTSSSSMAPVSPVLTQRAHSGSMGGPPPRNVYRNAANLPELLDATKKRRISLGGGSGGHTVGHISYTPFRERSSAANRMPARWGSLSRSVTASSGLRVIGGKVVPNSSRTAFNDISSEQSESLRDVIEPPLTPRSQEQASWPRSQLPVFKVDVPAAYQRRGRARRPSISAESDRLALADDSIGFVSAADDAHSHTEDNHSPSDLDADNSGGDCSGGDTDLRAQACRSPSSSSGLSVSLPLPSAFATSNGCASPDFQMPDANNAWLSSSSDRPPDQSLEHSLPLPVHPLPDHDRALSPSAEISFSSCSCSSSSAVPSSSSSSSSGSESLRSPSTCNFLEWLRGQLRVPHYPKSAEALHRIHQTLFDSFLFSSLNQMQKTIIFEAMQPLVVHAGDTVVKQGDPGEYFYVIDSGIFDVYQGTANPQKKVFTYKARGCFGEMVLMYNNTRNATVKARTDGLLWALDGPTFRRIVIVSGDQSKKLAQRFLSSCALLNPFSAEQRVQVADALEIMEFQGGEYVISQGGPPDRFFFIESGEALVTQSSSISAPPTEINRLRQGDYFGEIGCILGKERSANVVAIGHLRCLAMHKSAFNSLLADVFGTMHRRAQRYRYPATPETWPESAESPSSALADQIRCHFTM